LSLASLAVCSCDSNEEQTKLELAVQTISAQVDWFGDPPSNYPRGFLAAVATMNYVQSRLSPLNYSLLARERQRLPAKPEEYLDTGAALCNGQAETFRAILSRMGYRTRRVEFYWPGETPQQNQGHIGAEVFYSQQWHFFDVTWGTYFRRRDSGTDQVMSVADLLQAKTPRKLAVTNQSDLWLQQYVNSGLSPFEYLTASDCDVLVGQEGTVRLRPTVLENGDMEFKQIHKPKYVGRMSTLADNDGSLQYRISGLSGVAGHCTVHISGVQGHGVFIVRSANQEFRMPLTRLQPGKTEVELGSIDPADQLTFGVIAQGRERGYVGISSIRFDAVPR